MNQQKFETGGGSVPLLILSHSSSREGLGFHLKRFSRNTELFNVTVCSTTMSEKDGAENFSGM